MATVRINQVRKVQLAHRLTLPHVRRTSGSILNGAQRLAPRGDHRSGSGERKPGPTLVNSLYRRDVTSNAAQIVHRVGSDNRYAATMHQGSEAHEIAARGKLLKFRWERGNLLLAARAAGRRNSRGRRVGGRIRSRGGFFYFVRVRHPGNKRPVRYLTTPMHLYGRMNGFRTTSGPVSRTRLP